MLCWTQLWGYKVPCLARVQQFNEGDKDMHAAHKARLWLWAVKGAHVKCFTDRGREGWGHEIRVFLREVGFALHLKGYMEV